MNAKRNARYINVFATVQLLNSGTTQDTNALTPLEYYVLKRAYELGYFGWSRKCTLETLSIDVGLQRPQRSST